MEREDSGTTKEADYVTAIREEHRNSTSRLRGVTYLDHAGAALYSDLQMTEVMHLLRSNFLGNPHSGTGPGAAADSALLLARVRTLEWFKAPLDLYSVVFTAGASASLRLVGECFPWAPGSIFSYALESHASVLGLRERALASGACARCVSLHTSGLQVHSEFSRARAIEPSGAPARSLFCLPSECNFSGARLDVEPMIRSLCATPIDSSDTLVLLDAAKGAALDPPDLSGDCRPHFVVASYYKIFGYPTGFGCLLVRNDAMPLLTAGRCGWGGGSAAIQSATADVFVRREGVAGLEEGTAHVTAAVAVPRGFDAIARLPGGVRGADAHATDIASRLVAELRRLRHPDGTDAVRVYGWGSPIASSLLRGQGPTVAFNLLPPGHTAGGGRAPPLPCSAVEQALSLRGIALRSGCMCNPGACAAALVNGNSALVPVESCVAGGGEGGGPGVLRASFGYSSLSEDAFALVEAIKEFFCSTTGPSAVLTPTRSLTLGPPSFPRRPVRIVRVALYPVKGAAAFVVPDDEEWPLSVHGSLLHDRCWAVADASGAALTQSRCSRLALISPVVDLVSETLTLRFRQDQESKSLLAPLQLALTDIGGSNRTTDCTTNGGATLRVCGVPRDARQGESASQRAANAWLSMALQRPCTLTRSSLSSSFANDERVGLSVVTRWSCEALRQSVASRSGDAAAATVCEEAFRANIVLDDTECGVDMAKRVLPREAYEEDDWTSITSLRHDIEGRQSEIRLRVFSRCARCPQVLISPLTGEQTGVSKEPLLSLTKERMHDGRPRFGVLAQATFESGVGWRLRCNMLMQPE